jgi:site-specific DNA-methyltransferase (adenine-specific)
MEKNKLYAGNCLDIIKNFPKESIDCIVTSPPYFSLRNYHTEGEIGNEKTYKEYQDKMCDVFLELFRVLKSTGSFYLNIGDVYSEKNLLLIPYKMALICRRIGFILRNQIIWWKRSCLPHSVKDRFTVDFEPVFFFTKSQKYFFKQQFESFSESYLKDKRPMNVIRQKMYDKSKYKLEEAPEQFKQGGTEAKEKPPGRNKRCVWDVIPARVKEEHFAVYPEALITPMIKASCPDDGVVLDPFMGIGTTCIVAKKENKNYIGIDINPRYVEIAEKRIKETPVYYKLIKD